MLVAAAACRSMRRSLLITLLLGPLALWLALVAVSQANPATDGLRTQIRHAGQREQALAAGAGVAEQLIARLAAQLSILGNRVAAVQQQLAQDHARLSMLGRQAVIARAHLQRLRALLMRQRRQLSGWLVAVYEDGRPNAIEVLTTANGFADLLERMDFLHRLSERAGQITERIGAARSAAASDLRRVIALGVAQRQATLAAAAENAALQSMSAALAQRRTALDRARQLQLAALARTRSQRAALQGRLAHQLAVIAAAAVAPPPASVSAPSGSFAIPWPIVQCESGGQNLPPNSAGASGYYQILTSTWKGAGGSTPQAYQASKSEQDAIARRLWAGGAGASNWVCASLVGGG